jgi:hypothetical protein
MPDRYDGARPFTICKRKNLVYLIKPMSHGPKNIDDIKKVLIIVFLLTKTLLKSVRTDSRNALELAYRFEEHVDVWLV